MTTPKKPTRYLRNKELSDPNWVKKFVEGIPFDRGPGHHDAEPTHKYYPEANFCVECSEDAIATALREYAKAEVEKERERVIKAGGIIAKQVYDKAVREAAEIAYRKSDQCYEDSHERCNCVGEAAEEIERLQSSPAKEETGDKLAKDAISRELTRTAQEAREEMTNGEGKSVFWAKAFAAGAEAMRDACVGHMVDGDCHGGLAADHLRDIPLPEPKKGNL